jgi:hypothetical protein
LYVFSLLLWISGRPSRCRIGASNIWVWRHFRPTFPPQRFDELFAFDDDIVQVVGARRTSLTRLGLVLQIGFLRLTGRSLNSVQVIPPAVLARAG